MKTEYRLKFQGIEGDKTVNSTLTIKGANVKADAPKSKIYECAQMLAELHSDRIHETQKVTVESLTGSDI